MAHDHHGPHAGHLHRRAGGTPPDYRTAFALGIGLNLGFVVLEAVYGIIAQSMALVADAGHNLGDVLALALAWAATTLSRRLPSARYTYGLRGTTILAALFNAALLLVVTGGIAWESVTRLLRPVDVASDTVIWVALLGILINGGAALLFARGRARDVNIRGAFLHLAADAAVSFGVVLAGLGIGLTGWMWLDPAAGLAVACVIIVSTWGLLRDSLNLALNAVPGHIDPHAVRTYLGQMAGVSEVHDLHIWAMSTTETALTVHLVMPAGHPGDAWMAMLCAELQGRFNVNHPTVQVETGDTRHPCALAPEHLV